MPTAWAAFWQSVVRFQSDKVNPWLGLRNALGVALPLAGGAALGSISAGLAMSTGALNVAFRDSDAPYPQRARQMLLGSVVAGIAVFAGTLSGRNYWIAVAVSALWAFAAGMLVALNQSAADLGVMSLVLLVIYAAVPLDLERAALAGLLAVAGGLLQTALSLALWPLRPHDPERRALGNLFLELSRAAASPTPATQSPPATTQSIAAHNALAALQRDRSVESERFRLLLSQAERMRLALLALSRLRVRMEREDPTSPEAKILDRYFEICSRILSSVGTALQAGEPADAAAKDLQEIETLTEQLRETNSGTSPAAVMSMDARSQMDALTGQLRAAIDLERFATPAGISAFEQREAEKPWKLRLGGTLAILRANLTLKSAACRHAIRLAVCILIGDAIARGFALRRSYWLPMTIAIVLKPDFTATFSRGVLRLAGTFVGLGVATVLFHVLPPGTAAQVVVIALLMFIVRGFGSANFGILATSVTGLVVFLLALTGVSPKEVIDARALNTVIGGALALIAYWVWPTWERTQVNELMARMLDAYREYFRAIRESYSSPDPARLDRLRVAGRLARTNLEASIERAIAEPGASPERVSLMAGMLASSHRLAHALMALEAAITGSPPSTPREAFHVFANDVEMTLYLLAQTLRGSPIPPGALPDLREDHHALLHSGDPGVGPYALVNVEADRITNSLNTLSEEISRWVGQQT